MGFQTFPGQVYPSQCLEYKLQLLLSLKATVDILTLSANVALNEIIISHLVVVVEPSGLSAAS